MRSIGTSTDTKISVTQNFNSQSGQRLIKVAISGDYDHQENIEIRDTRLGQATFWASLEAADDSRVASTTAGLSQIISSLTNTTWLSIHRGEMGQPGRLTGRQSSIDRHLENISQRLAQYNSRRTTIIGDENTEFQKNMFLSFLTPRISLATLRQLGTLNITERIQQLRQILRQLGVQASDADANLSRYSEDLERAVLASQRRRQGRMGFTEKATLLSVNQANDVISFWSEYRERVAVINQGVNELLGVFRDYFDKKNVLLSDHGQFTFTPKPRRTPRREIRSGRSLTAEQLSSGEKQIYIFLLEALLQRDMISIFVADEPELSLHVAWQERLVNSILRVSPNAQLIFATHSPDIVGSSQDSIIDMDTVITNA